MVEQAPYEQGCMGVWVVWVWHVIEQVYAEPMCCTRLSCYIELQPLDVLRTRMQADAALGMSR